MTIASPGSSYRLRATAELFDATVLAAHLVLARAPRLAAVEAEGTHAAETGQDRAVHTLKESE